MILEKVLLGISLAAPIGPVSIEIIRRGLTHGFFAAIMICIGAVMGDGIFLVSAYFGLNTITSNKLIMGGLGFLGACLLCKIGYTNIRDSIRVSSISDGAVIDKKGFFPSVLLGLGLAIINPMSLVFWIGVFAASMTASADKSFAPNLFILIGVMVWSIFLSLIVSTGRRFLNDKFLRLVSIGSGILLTGYGLCFGYKAMESLL